MPSPAQVRAQTKWEGKVYDKILLRIRKDGNLTREDIQKAADSEKMSLNAFIMEAVREKIAKCEHKGT